MAGQIRITKLYNLNYALPLGIIDIIICQFYNSGPHKITRICNKCISKQYTIYSRRLLNLVRDILIFLYIKVRFYLVLDEGVCCRDKIHLKPNILIEPFIRLFRSLLFYSNYPIIFHIANSEFPLSFRKLHLQLSRMYIGRPCTKYMNRLCDWLIITMKANHRA
jgi:hypothetical protein